MEYISQNVEINIGPNCYHVVDQYVVAEHPFTYFSLLVSPATNLINYRFGTQVVELNKHMSSLQLLF